MNPILDWIGERPELFCFGIATGVVGYMLLDAFVRLLQGSGDKDEP